jgi:hypothetical protein
MPTPGTVHCSNVSVDRRVGELWEEKFCDLLPSGTAFIRHQKDRHGSAVYGVVEPNGTIRWRPSPDVTVLHGRNITTHHEIKHKNAHKGLLFGLEKYRIESLMDFRKKTGQDVYYTIHDHDCSGGRHSLTNDIKHWVTQTIEALSKDCDDAFQCQTWRNGARVMEMTMFWHRSRFDAFEDVLDNIVHFASRGDL